MSSKIQTNIVEPFLVLRQSLAPLKLSRWQMMKIFAKTLVFGSLPWGVFLVTVTSVILLYVFRAIFGGKQVQMPQELPVLKRNDSHYENIVKEGREKYPNEPFLAVNKRHSFVIFPRQCFDELKRLPERTASAKGFFHAANYGDWSLIGTETPALLKSIMADLTRALPARVLNRQQDTQKAFDAIVGHCPDWKAFNLMMTAFEIVSQINACSFVGRDLGCNRSWVRAVMMSPLLIHVAVTLTNACPAILRPLMKPILFLPSLKNQWDMKRLLTPMLQNDIKTFNEAKDKKELLRPRVEGDIPFTAFLLSRYKAAEATIKQLVTDYVLVSFDSTPSTASALYHALCELAQHPEAAKVMRQEIEEVMVDGQLPSTHLQELKRMDSFLRESFRMHPVSLFTLQRYIETPVKLSVGPTIPAGAIVGIDSQSINRSPELWEDPDKFDMDRFYRLREQPGNDNRYHFLTTGSDSPGWGDGTQACPGRFFATSTLKIALAHVVMNYDIKLEEGCLPLNITPLANGTWKPDDKVTAYFKSRS
ncbi:cytochrome p450 oxidoreductase [Colletotrichum truncatum]|uniref:Cytochrome p450 oxidoreductase n=1 Tax=Colletotrichum truncatum TaxID=5467 RepID=A0ACC3ZBT3_COLTU|nr:cytochrome p450 oxidoreductase [Colletotrichum truncatum]KAF6783841.1 cytochrome p450 oxidoreductase [Colletotrichum truncatum]